MISNCSFRKLLAEDMKRRFWLLLLSVYLYITYIVDYALAQSGQRLLFGDDRLGPASKPLLFITMLLAVLSALQGFSFLFSEEKTDFYFSLPVKRNRLFLTVYINGLIISLVPCLFSRLICYFVEGSRMSEALQDVWLGMLVNTFGFLMVYHLVLCVLLLAGQFLIAAAGTALSFFYGIFTFGFVFQKYSSSFFNTYYKIDLINALAVYVSPYHLYRALAGLDTIQEIGQWKLGDYIIPFTVVAAIAAGLFFAAFFLYLKRPAESAGQTLAFGHSKRIIKFIFAVPAALTVGYYSMLCSLSGRSLLLLFVGLLFASFVLNGLLEALFQSDFKGFLSHRMDTVILCFLCVAAAGSFYFDIWQFDDYSPKGKDVDSAAVYIYGLDDAEEIPVSSTGSGFGRADDQLETMSLTKENKTALLSWLSAVREKTAKGEAPLTFAAVAYRTAGGHTSYRKYPIYSPEDLETFSSIYEAAEYKTGAFPLLADKNVGTRHFLWSNGVQSFHLDLTEEENEALLKQLFEDCSAVSILTLKAELPIGDLSLVYTGSESGERMLVYPSFTGTLDFLEKLGLPVRSSIKDYKITELQIYEKHRDTGPFGKVTLSRSRVLDTDSVQEINEVLPELIPDGYAVNPLLNPQETKYQAMLNVKDTPGRTIRYITAALKNGKTADSLPSQGE